MISIARWESRGGKWFVELFRLADGSYQYKAVGASGYMGTLADDTTAIATLEPRINDFQADANKSPMQRVR